MTGWDLKDQQKVVHKLRRVGCVHPRPLQAGDGMCQGSVLADWRWYRHTSSATFFLLVELQTVTTLFLQVKIKNGSLNTSLSRNKFLPFQGKTMAILEGVLLFVLLRVIIYMVGS